MLLEKLGTDNEPWWLWAQSQVLTTQQAMMSNMENLAKPNARILLRKEARRKKINENIIKPTVLVLRCLKSEEAFVVAVKLLLYYNQHILITKNTKKAWFPLQKLYKPLSSSNLPHKYSETHCLNFFLKKKKRGRSGKYEVVNFSWLSTLTALWILNRILNFLG